MTRISLCLVVVMLGACGSVESSGDDAAHGGVDADVDVSDAADESDGPHRVDAASGIDAASAAENMATVPAGPFMMGCNAAVDGDTWCSAPALGLERPYHEITLDEFAIDVTEVSELEYGGCIADGECSAPAEGQLDPNSYLPVRNVTWQQAAMYCAWRSARLPTEAEWEKAARGTDGRRYPWGSAAPDCDRVNYGQCTGDEVHAVNAHESGASPFGVLNLAGNVAEWVADWYSFDYYAASPSENPTGPSVGTERSVRGGSLTSTDKEVRASARRGSNPELGFSNVGFRCAR